MIDSERQTVYGETEGVVRDRALSARAGKEYWRAQLFSRVRTYAQVSVQCDAGGVVLRAGPVVPFWFCHSQRPPRSASTPTSMGHSAGHPPRSSKSTRRACRDSSLHRRVPPRVAREKANRTERGGGHCREDGGDRYDRLVRVGRRGVVAVGLRATRRAEVLADAFRGLMDAS